MSTGSRQRRGRWQRHGLELEVPVLLAIREAVSWGTPGRLICLHFWALDWKDSKSRTATAPTVASLCWLLLSWSR